MRIFKLLFFFFTATLLVTSCNSNNSKTKGDDTTSANNEEVAYNTNLEKAPQFEVTTIDGEHISLEKSLSENKPMLIYFTASWCPMCAQNWPAISEVYREYQDKVNFVAISIDPTDDKDVMTKLAAEKELDFPLVQGNPQVMLDFDVQSQATTVGVNKEGYVEFQKNKSILTVEEYRSLLEQLIK